MEPSRDHFVWLVLVLSAYPLVSPLPTNLARFALGAAILIWLVREAGRFVGWAAPPDGVSPLHALAAAWLALFWMAFSSLNALSRGRMGPVPWALLAVILAVFVALVREADEAWRSRERLCGRA